MKRSTSSKKAALNQKTPAIANITLNCEGNDLIKNANKKNPKGRSKADSISGNKSFAGSKSNLGAGSSCSSIGQTNSSQGMNR
jgi:hypothetical protein